LFDAIAALSRNTRPASVKNLSLAISFQEFEAQFILERLDCAGLSAGGSNAHKRALRPKMKRLSDTQKRADLPDFHRDAG